MKIEYSKYNAFNIFKPVIKNPGYPSLNMNLDLDMKFNKENIITGYGVYAISLKHEVNKNKIIYIGKFQGEKKNIKGGDPRSRWFKHIATATLLHRNLLWRSKRLLIKEIIRSLKHLKNDTENLKLLYGSIFNLSESELIKKINKENGLQISKNRMRLCTQNFNLFYKGRPNTEVEINEILKKFDCHYWKVESDKFKKKSEIKQQMDKIEGKIIDIYKDKLPMNNEYKVNEKNFYHYNPDNLIDVDSSTFISFNSNIVKLIKNFLI
tara:strand:- start:77 stop:874 length:798 start_codon:yes stop_codon:yes gene_type:complete